MIRSIKLQNYRSLEAIDVSLSPVSVFFGPNGSGKSSLLDAFSFVRDCLSKGPEEASSIRGGGKRLLFDTSRSPKISIEFVTTEISYNIRFRVESGRLSPSPSEVLTRLSDQVNVLVRPMDHQSAETLDEDTGKQVSIALRAKDQLAVAQVFLNTFSSEVTSLVNLMRDIRSWHIRSIRLDDLKQRGSTSGMEKHLNPNADNLWSVLRNVALSQHVDTSWDTIVAFMREANPSFHNIVIDQLGPNVVYAQFLEKYRQGPTPASQISDGYLQLLVLLTSLFSEPKTVHSTLIYDEPEISLHPWAIATFAKAVKLATSEWNKQVLIATHSPVLMSQFESTQCFATTTINGCTNIEAISQIEGIQDLLDQYATGSLYMSEVIGGQSAEAAVEPLK